MKRLIRWALNHVPRPLLQRLAGWAVPVAGLFYVGDTAYTLGLLGVSIIGLIVVLVKYGGGLRAYRRVNRSAPGTYWGWTSPAFLIFVIVNVAITILSFVTAMMGV